MCVATFIGQQPAPIFKLGKVSGTGKRGRDRMQTQMHSVFAEDTHHLLWVWKALAIPIRKQF